MIRIITSGQSRTRVSQYGSFNKYTSNHQAHSLASILMPQSIRNDSAGLLLGCSGLIGFYRDSLTFDGWYTDWSWIWNRFTAAGLVFLRHDHHRFTLVTRHCIGRFTFRRNRVRNLSGETSSQARSHRSIAT